MAVLITYAITCALLDRLVQMTAGFLLTLIVCGVGLRMDHSLSDQHIDMGSAAIAAALLTFSVFAAAFLISECIKGKSWPEIWATLTEDPSDTVSHADESISQDCPLLPSDPVEFSALVLGAREAAIIDDVDLSGSSMLPRKNETPPRPGQEERYNRLIRDYPWFNSTLHLDHSDAELAQHDIYMRNSNNGWLALWQHVEPVQKVVAMIVFEHFSDDPRFVCHSPLARLAPISITPPFDVLAAHPKALYAILAAFRKHQPLLFHICSNLDINSILLAGDVSS